MIRCILILLISFVGIFAARAPYYADHCSIVPQYNPNNDSYPDIGSYHIFNLFSGIIEGENILKDYFGVSNKCLYTKGYLINLNEKSDFIAHNKNLLSSIRNDIHFLSILLI